MSRLPAILTAEPGPECFCGSELKAVSLPADLAVTAASKRIWVHVHNGDTRCYPEAPSADDRAATAEPAEAAR
jgi:hypothetical protein